MFSGGLLPACSRLSSVMDLALDASRHAAIVYVASLQLPQNLLQVRACFNV